MCGIAGVLARRVEMVDKAHVAAMLASMRQRGPDDEGIWVDPSGRAALGHRRLSIIDLAPTGHQPMLSPSGQYVISYNGEIYNYADIRHELEQSGYVFRGTSDTEVLACAFEKWGIEGALKRCIGMFAIALWDTRERVLHLIRDRLGIKPLCYAATDGSFIFASDLNALLRHPACPREISRPAVLSYLQSGYVPAPQSIIAGVQKVLPGHIVSVRAGEAPRTQAYWRFLDAVASGRGAPAQGSIEETIDAIDQQLRDAVRLRMIADVPLGAFLSGGTDSPLVVAAMQSLSSQPVRTFTIGLPHPDFDESQRARALAEHLGTSHTELCLSPHDVLATIPLMTSVFDEPFADTSQIPTYLVSRLARSAVTVALSGDGGDELFGGYPRYHATQRLWSKLNTVPKPVRHTVGRMLTAIPVASGASAMHRVSRRAYRLGALLTTDSIASLQLSLTARSHDVDGIFSATQAQSAVLDVPADVPESAERLMVEDTLRYLPDDILTKLDRTSMAVSLEARVPLLDHRMVELVWRIPFALKWQNQPKWLLRQLLYRYFPANLVDGPKRGFDLPVDDWLRFELRDWADDVLASPSVARSALLDSRAVSRMWSDHRSARANRGGALWSVLMLQGWQLEHPDCY